MDAEQQVVVLDVGPVLFAGALSRALARRGLSVVHVDDLPARTEGPFNLAVVQREGSQHLDADVVITLHDFDSPRPDGSIGIVRHRGGHATPVCDLDDLFGIVEGALSRHSSRTVPTRGAAG